MGVGKPLQIAREEESQPVGWVEPFDVAQDRQRDTHPGQRAKTPPAPAI